ncbi:hypothetical protein [Streptomyces sp. SID1121]|uniref:hypothetical protein n=1 Tax=Streptomyces sp. SID1121 TaxID=3425888 RepID=UPI004057BE70
MSVHAPRTPPVPAAPLTGPAPACEARIAPPAVTAGPLAPAAGPADPVAALLTPLVAAGPEAYGMTDRTAARFRHCDVFPLPGEPYARAPRGTTRPARADDHRPVPGADFTARVRPLPLRLVGLGARPAAPLRPQAPDGLDFPAVAPATKHDRACPARQHQARPALEDTPGDGGTPARAPAHT